MEKMREKELALDLLADVAGGFVQAVALHCFINNIDIAPGGASGMAILLNRLTNLPIGTLTFLINIPLLIASWIYLGKEKTIKTLKTVAIMTVILDGLVTPYFPVYSGDILPFRRSADRNQSCRYIHARLHHRRRRYRRKAFTEVSSAHADRKSGHGDGPCDHPAFHGGIPEYRIRSLWTHQHGGGNLCDRCDPLWYE